MRVKEYQRQQEGLRQENEASRLLREESICTLQHNKGRGGGLPDQVANFHPFTDNILQESNHHYVFPMKMFIGHHDPLAHVKMFHTQILI